MPININSKIRVVKTLNNITDSDIIKNEPMLFRCTTDSALIKGGELTRIFISNLPDEFLNSNCLIDSRSHMLMEGFWPCIPGWHHDDVPRERIDKQPEYINPSYRSKHIMMILGGGSKTKFALGESDFPEIPIGEKVYKKWHHLVDEKIKNGILSTKDCNFGELVEFDWNSWHCGTPAYERNWRFFIRATINTNARARNEVRNQVQVYLSDPYEGW